MSTMNNNPLLGGSISRAITPPMQRTRQASTNAPHRSREPEPLIDVIISDGQNLHVEIHVCTPPPKRRQ